VAHGVGRGQAACASSSCDYQAGSFSPATQVCPGPRCHTFGATLPGSQPSCKTVVQSNVLGKWPTTSRRARLSSVTAPTTSSVWTRFCRTNMRICILTIGTRGDVQPYIALGRGLQAAGHEVTVATLLEFRSLVMDYGLQHDTLRGDFIKAAQRAEAQSAVEGPGVLLKLPRQYIEMARETLEDEWASARKADVLVYSSASLGGYHIAEKMGVPAFASFPAPLYSPTRESMAGGYLFLSYLPCSFHRPSRRASRSRNGGRPLTS
jgi:hypothetical protein